MTKKGRNVVQSVGLLVLFGIYQCNAQYVVDVMRMTSFGEEELVHKCLAKGGNFGMDVSDFIISEENLGCGVGVEPVDACGPVRIAQNHTTRCHNLFAFVSRSNISHPCKFSHQAFMVQNSTYPFRLVIFYNYPGQEPISMEGTELRDKVNIPVLMISHACKEEIAKKFSDTAGYRLRVRIDPGYYELFRYLIPFLVVIVFCFALFLITLCVRGCVERRKLNKRRLSKRNLKKIPVKKYRLGDDPDTCAICLESFASGEKLRHLPCRHVFHCNCIDVWLTQTRKICPLCKRKIGTDSDSECSTNDLASTSQGPNDATALYNNADNQSGFELPVPQGQMVDLWSSQEALVDQDIVLHNTTRRSITGFVRNAFRKLRNSPRHRDVDVHSGLEGGSYLVRQQTTSNDNDHLLENEVSDPTSSSELNIPSSEELTVPTSISTHSLDTATTTTPSSPSHSCQ
ncbi:RING-type domain-containing protein [Caenorhabditis elegans]|uniref:RING-type domain-containing protein n=1 Tax=Caenorhabditis elegans TaxID=6239 RepID=Q9XX98_CAEEL|nr:RING-type domain-containing protein [Caenorhabditis elegans]CAA20925.1 RING-type domain-containing protein [Caenorhabditis elegans]|eukprot:NP_510498.1 Uncharacterized protein CELE_C18B12.4 [Caenorhabditis elegans]